MAPVRVRAEETGELVGVDTMHVVAGPIEGAYFAVLGCWLYVQWAVVPRSNVVLLQGRKEK